MLYVVLKIFYSSFRLFMDYCLKVSNDTCCGKSRDLERRGQR